MCSCISAGVSVPVWAVQRSHLNEFFDLSSWSNWKKKNIYIFPLFPSSLFSCCFLPALSGRALRHRHSTGVTVPCGLTVHCRLWATAREADSIFFVTPPFSSCWQKCHFMTWAEWLSRHHKRRKTSRLDLVQPLQDVHALDWVKRVTDRWAEARSLTVIRFWAVTQGHMWL